MTLLTKYLVDLGGFSMGF